jgi:hypothetical protein
MAETVTVQSLRELDVLVAVSVMRLSTVVIARDRTGDGFYAAPPEIAMKIKDHNTKKYVNYLLPYYSSNIEAAWELMQRLKEIHPVWLQGSELDGWRIWIGSSSSCLNGSPTGRGETIEIAICLAALKMVGVEVSLQLFDRFS